MDRVVFMAPVGAHPRDLHRLLGLHCRGVISKPVKRKELYELIVSKKVGGSGRIRKTAPTMTRSRILLVEDNPVNREVAVKILSKEGARMTIAENGLEAVNHICEKRERFDLVLMDVEMPVMDGFESTRTIMQWGRENLKTAIPPVIAMTAHAFGDIRDKCLKAGMSDHITKPIDPPKFVKTVAKWLQQSASMDEVTRY